MKIAKNFSASQRATTTEAVKVTLTLAESDGHVYLNQEELLRRCLAGYPYFTEQNVLQGVKALRDAGEVVVTPGHCAREDTLHAEDALALSVAQRIHESEMKSSGDWEAVLEKAEASLDVTLSTSQCAAALGALSHSMSIITGGAGSGKTTLLRVLCSAFQSSGGSEHPQTVMEDTVWCGSVLLMAPTGKAAHRMAELARYPAYTIHSVLYSSRGVMLMNGSGAYFARLVIVDEASMVDIRLLQEVMAHLSPAARLVLVGDPAQLPSIGPGNALGDLIASGLPVYQLTDNFRQQERQNALVSNLARIRARDTALTYDESFHLLTAGSGREIEDLLLELYVSLQLGGKSVQMLTPVGRTLCCSTNILNRKAQALVNPTRSDAVEIAVGSHIFRVGDRVVQLKNNDRGRNGDVATVVAMRNEKGKTWIKIAFDDGGKAEYSTYEIDRDGLLDHAYALTIHKSQGSEYDYVLLPLAAEQAFVWSSNMLYTAVSRAKKGIILVGRELVLKQAIRRGPPPRNSDLATKIAAAVSTAA